MKRKKVVLSALTLFILICSVSSCSKNIEYSDKEVTPGLTTYNSSNDYYYIVDNATRVVYLKYSRGYQCGMTVMLNADGTPVTADQLGLS